MLEQFLTILPEELQAWVQAYPLESGEDAVTVLENLEKDTGDSGQQVGRECAWWPGRSNGEHLSVKF